MKSDSLSPVWALDSMLFIYLFEEDIRFIDKVKPLFTKIENGEVKGITSIISVIEVLSAPKLKNDKQKSSIFEQFFYEAKNLQTLALDRKIAREAYALRQTNAHLRTPDSIQIATGIANQADIFLTNDKRLKTVKVKSLKIKTIMDL